MDKLSKCNLNETIKVLNTVKPILTFILTWLHHQQKDLNFRWVEPGASHNIRIANSSVFSLLYLIRMLFLCVEGSCSLFSSYQKVHYMSLCHVFRLHKLLEHINTHVSSSVQCGAQKHFLSLWFHPFYRLNGQNISDKPGLLRSSIRLRVCVRACACVLSLRQTVCYTGMFTLHIRA